MKRALAAVVGCAGLVCAPIALAGPAAAEASGTVMADTQRMSDPTLNGTQKGTYPKGQRLTLVCYERGQSVRGYYSDKGRAAGAYSDIWYRTKDGSWVADIDVSTGTNDPVTPLCGSSAGERSTSSTRTKGTTGATNMFAANFYGQCTYGAQEKIKEHAGYYIPTLSEYAARWVGQARADGWTVTTTPSDRAVVVFGPGVAGSDPHNGHVAWVDAVNSDGSISITEMNFLGAAGQWHTRTVAHQGGMNYILIP